MPPQLQLQKSPRKGDGGWKRSVFTLFLGWREDRNFMEECFGWFSKAGLLEWMHFVIFHARSRERSQRIPGQFLSRHCFTLCITVEVEPRIVKQYKCPYCCICKNYCGKGMEGGKKCLCVVFWLTRRSWVCRFCFVLGHPIAQATSYCLLPDTLWLWASKNAFKVGSVKFANSLSLPSTVKKVSTRSKSSQGT